MLKYLGACAQNPKEEASQYLGLLSMIVWMMVGIPQIVKNFRNLDGMAGVSFFLLFQWAGGDITNLVGSLLTHQLPFQIYLAVYFVFIDVLLLLQYSTYFVKQRRKCKAETKAESNGSAVPRVILCLMGLFLCSHTLLPSSSLSASKLRGLEPGPSGHISRALLSMTDKNEVVFNLENTKPLLFQPEFNKYERERSHFQSNEEHSTIQESLLGATPSFWHDKTDLIGYSIGILSSIFYLGSRIAQIVKNYKKKSTEGLSKLMFFLAVLGNLAYGFQIIVHSVETEFLLEKTPWLVGSLGVIGLDITLLAQFEHYKDKPGNIDDVIQSLVNNEITVNGDSPSVYSPALSPATEVANRQNDRHAYIY